MDNPDSLSIADLRAGAISVPSHAVYRAFEQETVALNIETGEYYGLNPTAGRMIELLEETGAFGATAERLVEEFARPREEIEGDLAELCNGLRARGLIVVASAW